MPAAKPDVPRHFFGRAYPDATAEPDDFNEQHQVGIICGGVEGRDDVELFGLDRDGDAEWVALERILGFEIPSTLSSKGDRHRFYWLRAGHGIKQRNGIVPQIDTRPHCGGYFREPWEWDGEGFDVEAIAEFPADAVEALRALVGTAPDDADAFDDGKPHVFGGVTWEPDISAIANEIAPAGVPDERHNVVRALGGYLARRGYTPEAAANAVRSQLPSDKPNERAKQAHEAARRGWLGLAVPGWDYLRERFGERVVRRLEAAVRDPVEPKLFAWDGKRQTETWSIWWSRYWPRLEASIAKRFPRRGPGRPPTKAAKRAEALAANTAAIEAAAPDLARLLEVDDEGRPYPTVNNVYYCVRHLLGGALCFDEVACEYALTRDVRLGETTFRAGLWQDVFEAQLQRELNVMRVRKPTDGDVRKAIAMLGDERKINAHGDWLRALANTWDGESRVEGALCEYWGCADTPAVRATSRVMFTSIAARGLRPGCKVDTMPVLIGNQGALKSSSFKVLVWGALEAPAEYGAARRFGDSTLDLRHKDAKISIRGMLLWELGELASLVRTETETIKAFLSSASDKFRPPYGHNDVECKRTVVFVGSTNESIVNYDHTGGRRYMPVRVGTIDLEAIAADRELLLGEAAMLVLNGEQHWPTKDEASALKIAVADVTEEHPWHAPIAAWVRKQTKEFTIADVLDVARGAVNIEAGRQTSRLSQQVGNILRALGCEGRKSHGVTRWRAPRAALRAV